LKESISAVAKYLMMAERGRGRGGRYEGTIIIFESYQMD